MQRGESEPHADIGSHAGVQAQIGHRQSVVPLQQPGVDAKRGGGTADYPDDVPVCSAHLVGPGKFPLGRLPPEIHLGIKSKDISGSANACQQRDRKQHETQSGERRA